jgi:hypothetical protein
MAEERANAFIAQEDVAGASSVTQQDVAVYVATLSRDLKRMAERHDLATLAYLLEIVHLEASRNSGKR